MSIKELRERAEQRPFRPFAIETVGGRFIGVQRAGDIFFPERKPETFIVFEDTGNMSILEASNVASLSIV